MDKQKAIWESIEFDGSDNILIQDFTIMIWTDNSWIVSQYLQGKFKGY